MTKINKNVPCYECKNRHSGCHSSCDSYKDFSQKRTDELSMMRMKRLEAKMIDDVKFESIHKATHSKRTQTARGR